MTPTEYAAMTGASATVVFDLSPESPAAMPFCAGCHGDAGSEPVAGLAPALRGQNAAYLARALDEYASGMRESGIMEPVAAALAPAARRRLAEAFAAMPAADAVGAPAALAATGEGIARAGLPQQNVPPCLSCHSGERSPHFPRLQGLSAFYIANQLRLFREGVRGTTPYGAIMAPIAARLTPEQAQAAAAYFSAQDNRRAAAIAVEAAP
jgi:cytochrome c553